MDKFITDFTEGFEATAWILCEDCFDVPPRGEDKDEDEDEDFHVANMAVSTKLVGAKLEDGGNLGAEGLLGSSITWNHRVGILRRSSVFGALTGRVGGQRMEGKALSPLPIHEILDVMAGCVGFGIDSDRGVTLPVRKAGRAGRAGVDGLVESR